MPELPEVETVRRGLADLTKNAPLIIKVEIRNKALRFQPPKGFAKNLTGEKIENIERRAKYLLVQTTKYTMLSHLGMTGSWRILVGQPEKHDHLILTLSSGEQLVYNDPRRFGYVDLLKRGEEAKSRWLKNLGPEPFDELQFHAQYLLEKTKGKSVALKTFLMDSRIVVGVGNIYASEALYVAKLKPTRSVAKLKLIEAESLVAAIRQVLKSAIDAGGTTFRDFKNFDGGYGSNQQKLAVYERSGERCFTCKNTIVKITQTGRSTYFCKVCQR